MGSLKMLWTKPAYMLEINGDEKKRNKMIAVAFVSGFVCLEATHQIE